MNLHAARVRRATIAVVDRLRRDGESVDRTTVAGAMGVSGPCAAHRLKVLAELGVIRVDPFTDSRWPKGRYRGGPRPALTASESRDRVEAARRARL